MKASFPTGLRYNQCSIQNRFAGVRGYALVIPPQSFSILLFHPNSLSVELTNNTIKPFWDWVLANNETQVTSTSTLYLSFFDFFTGSIKESSVATPVWLGGRLISREALETKSDKLAQFVNRDSQFVGSINIGRPLTLFSFV